MTTKAERVREAKAALDKATKDLAAYDKDTTRLEATKAKALAQMAREEKRTGYALVSSSNGVEFARTVDIRPSYWHTDDEKGLRAALNTKGTNAAHIVTESGGPGRSLAGFEKKARRPTPADTASLLRLQKVVQAKQEALDNARSAFATARAAAYDTGSRFGLTELEDLVVHNGLLRARTRGRTDSYMGGRDYSRLTLEDKVRDATEHLAGMKGKPDTCECRECRGERTARKNAEAEVARRKRLPRHKFTCPTHGAVSGRLDRRMEWVKLDPDRPYGPTKQVDDYPYGICPVDGKFVRLDDLYAKEEKRAARAAKKAEAVEERGGCGNDGCTDANACEECLAPTCDYCGTGQGDDGEDWDGDTGCHVSCEEEAA